jgi:hypothetical protein
MDKDGNMKLSLDEWRRPFEDHTDSWLQIADTVPPTRPAPTQCATHARLGLAGPRDRRAGAPPRLGRRFARRVRLVRVKDAACPISTKGGGARPPQRDSPARAPARAVP